METNKPGSTNMEEISNSITSIEFLTKMYKKRRITTKEYTEKVGEQLLILTNNKRDYIGYLKDIGHL